ncbi:MAG: hypothetical protein JWL64_1307 [Frankiales bacterium]|nr:hypothetical protein [Frankiales bacterium]
MPQPEEQEPAPAAQPARHSLLVLLRPQWVVLHLLVVAACVVMVELGMWQWRRGGELHALRNYSYCVEWYAFAVLTVVGWLKICHDELIPDPEAGVLHGAVEDPVRARELALAEDAADPEVAAWNRQFAELHLKHALKEAGLSPRALARDRKRQLDTPDRKQLS